MFQTLRNLFGTNEIRSATNRRQPARPARAAAVACERLEGRAMFSAGYLGYPTSFDFNPYHSIGVGGQDEFSPNAATLGSMTQAAMQYTPMPAAPVGNHGYLTSAQEAVVSQQIVNQTNQFYDSLGPNNVNYYADPKNMNRLLSPNNPTSRIVSAAAVATPSPLQTLNPALALAAYYAFRPSTPAPVVQPPAPPTAVVPPAPVVSSVQPPIYGGGGLSHTAAASSQGLGQTLGLFGFRF